MLDADKPAGGPEGLVFGGASSSAEDRDPSLCVLCLVWVPLEDSEYRAWFGSQSGICIT